MNPDGTNPREVTSELVPVSGYDISGDGTTIAYGAGGVVKKMSLSATLLRPLPPAAISNTRRRSLPTARA